MFKIKYLAPESFDWRSGEVYLGVPVAKAATAKQKKCKTKPILRRKTENRRQKTVEKMKTESRRQKTVEKMLNKAKFSASSLK